MYHGVFDSAAEAESSADTYEARVRIMKERLDFEQLDRKKGNVEYENKIEELEQQLLDKDRRIEQLKNDRAAILEEARERRETNSHEQKMSVEHFKFTAIVVTTVLGMIPLLIKLSSKKTT
jgi:predicted RNase H-like nuclease (RuvC/YqgF family)